MFKKLLSNLPFNPSLIGQVAFYAKRMKRESAVRWIGFVFMGLTMVVQVFAVLSPARASLDQSKNDIIPGGFQSKVEAYKHCTNDDFDFAKLSKHFGVTCADINAGSVGPLNSTKYGKDLATTLYSIGRIKYGKPGEFSVTVENAGVFYMRPLWTWDTGVSSTYTAISGTRSEGPDKGKPFFILFNCGNIVVIGKPLPPPPPPPPPPVIPPKTLSCSALAMNVADGARVPAGSAVIVYGQAAGEHIPTGQKVDMYYDLVDANNKVISTQKAQGLGFVGTAANDTHPRTFTINELGQYRIRLTVKYDQTKTAAGSATGACLKTITIQKPCEAAQDTKDTTACLILTKAARNLTQNAPNADGTTVHTSDTLEYTLSTTNTSRVTIKGYVIQEDITDLLEYATVIDYHGGTVDSHNMVSWPKVDIKKGETVQKILTVQVHNSIDQTNTPASNGGSHDCIINNTYGNPVNIHVPCSVIKKTSQVVTALPNTGPGTSLAIGFGITVIIAYFFARSRLFATELDIVREDFVSSGGA